MLSQISKFKIISTLARTKLLIIEILSNTGSGDIDDVIKIFLGNLEDYQIYNNEYKDYLSYFGCYFNISRVECYKLDENCKENLTFNLNQYGKKDKKNISIVLSNNQLKLPSINKFNFRINIICPTHHKRNFRFPFCIQFDSL